MLVLTVALLGRVDFLDDFCGADARELGVTSRPKFMMLDGVTGSIGCSLPSMRESAAAEDGELGMK
jgi:hypothetical protein